MATLTEIEEQVLEEVGENLSSPENWEGDDELREALGDALDEACMLGDYFQKKIQIKLKDSVGFYKIEVDGYIPLWVKRARLVEQNRRLEPESLVALSIGDKKWMISRGSPRSYVPFATDILIIHPCYSEDGGIVELDLVCAPAHYSYKKAYLSIRDELELTLVHYGKYYLLLRSGRDIKQAMLEFGEYLKSLGAHALLKHHNRAVSRLLFRSIGDEKTLRTD